MSRSVITAVVVVALIGVTAAVASPLLGLQALRDALVARNSEALAALVEPDRLRGNIAARIHARYEQVAVRVPVEPVVERLLTPSGLIAAICDGGALTVQGTVPTSTFTTSSKPVRPSCVPRMTTLVLLTPSSGELLLTTG